jgi:hypothetical protein
VSRPPLFPKHNVGEIGGLGSLSVVAAYGVWSALSMPTFLPVERTNRQRRRRRRSMSQRHQNRCSSRGRHLRFLHSFCHRQRGAGFHSVWACRERLCGSFAREVHAGFLLEVILTMIFLFIIMGATHRKALSGFAPVAIGLGLTIVHLIGMPLTQRVR